MIIITDAASAGDLFEKYAIGNSPTLTVAAEASDTFAPGTVERLLAYKAEILTIPEGVSKAFAIGVAVDKKWTNPNAIYVVSKDADIIKSAKLMGFQTELPKKGTGTKGKAKATRVKTASGTAGIKKTATNTEAVKEASKNSAAGKTDGMATDQAKTSKGRQPKSAKPKTTSEELAKKKAPKQETVYKDNSDAAGSKPVAAFVKALTKAGVNKTDAQGVWNAVVKSSAFIVYDMQLRLCLLDADKAMDIYKKTKDIFDDLKGLTQAGM